jgi:hypothetical protein
VARTIGDQQLPMARTARRTPAGRVAGVLPVGVGLRFALATLLTCCSPKAGREATMNLELKLSLDRGEYLVGESVLARVSLTNLQTVPVEIPSLDLNDRIVSFTIGAASGEEIGSYDGVSFQRRIGTPRPTTNQVTSRMFRGGETETLNKDLLLLRPALPAGRYTLTVHYAWEEIELHSAACPFEVLPSAPQQVAVGWDSDMAGPYHLVFAWVDQLRGQPLLLEATTFGSDHRAFQHTSRLGQVGTIDQLAVARDQGDVAQLRSAVVWKEQGKLRWQATGPGTPGPVSQADVALDGWRIVPSPLRGKDGAVAVLVSNGARTQVQALRLQADGTKVALGAWQSGTARHQAFLVSPQQQALYVRTTDGLGEGSGTHVECVVLDTSSKAAVLLQAKLAALALAAVIDESGEPSAAVALDAGEPGKPMRRVVTRLFRGPLLQTAVDGPEFEVPADATLQLVLGADGSVHVLAVRPAGTVLYGVGEKPLEPITLPAGAREPQLVVGRAGAAFLVAATPADGLHLAPLSAVPVPGSMH